jgi:hypothetical protein
VHEKLEASAEHIVARLDEVAADLNSGSAQSGQQIEAIEEALEKLSASVDSQVAGLSAAQQSDREQVSSSVAQVEGDLSRRLQEMERGLASKVDALQDATQAELSKHASSAAQVAEQLRTKLAQTQESLDAKLDQAVESMSTATEASRQSFEQRCAAAVSSMDDKLELRCGNLHGQLSEELGSLKENHGNDLQRVHARIDDEIAAAQGLTQSAREQLDRQTGSIGMELNQLQTTMAATTTSLQTEFNERFARLDQQLVSLGKQTDGGFVETHTRVDRVTTEMQQFIDQTARDKESLSADLSHVQSQLNESTKHHGNAIAQHYTDFISMCASIEKKMVDTKAAQSAIITDHFDIFERTRGEVETSIQILNQSMQEQQQNFGSRVDALEKDLDSKDGVLTAKLSEDSKRHTENIRTVQHQLESICQSLDSKFTEKTQAQEHEMKMQTETLSGAHSQLKAVVAAQAQALSGVEQSLTRQVEESASRLDGRLSGEIKALDTSWSRQHTEISSAQKRSNDAIRETEKHLDKCCGRVTKLESQAILHHAQLSEQCSQLSEKLQTTRAEHEGEHQAIRLAAQTNHDQLRIDIDTQAAQQSQYVSEQSARIDTLDRDLHGACESLDKKIAERCAALDSSLLTQQRVYEAMDETIAQNSSATEARFHAQKQSLSEMRSDFANQLALLDEKFNGEILAHDKVANAHYERLAQATIDLNEQVSRQLTGHETRLADLAAASQKHYSHFTGVFTDLDEKFTTESRNRDERGQQEHSDLQALCSALELKVDGHYSQVNSKFDEQLASFTHRCEQLDDKVNANSATAAEQTQSVASAAQRKASDLENLCADLNQSVAAQFLRAEQSVKLLTDKLDDEIRRNTSGLTALEARVMDHVSKQDTRLSGVEQSTAQNLAHFTERCNTLQESNKSEALQELMRVQYDHFTTTCENLDTKYTTKDSAQNERIMALRDHFTDTYAKLEQRVEERAINQDSRIDGLQELVGEHRLYFVDTCGKLDRKMTAVNAAQDERADLQREHFSQLCKATDTKLTEVEQALGDSVSDQKTQLQKEHDLFTALVEQVFALPCSILLFLAPHFCSILW